MWKAKARLFIAIRVNIWSGPKIRLLDISTDRRRFMASLIFLLLSNSSSVTARLFYIYNRL